MLVKKASTSKLARWRSMFWVSTKVKESLTVNSFCVISGKTGPKNFTSLFAGVSISEKIGLNGGNPFVRGLCTLANP